MVGQRRTLGNESYACRDQEDSDPTRGRHRFVQIELGNQREQHIAQRSRGENVGQVGPGKGGHVGSEESEQKQNAQGDRRIQHSQDDVRQVIQGDAADLFHAPREKRIADGGAQGHAGENQILAKGHTVFPSGLGIELLVGTPI